MSSGMNTEQAKEYAKTMTYSEAVANAKYSKGIKYRKATMIKLRELAEIADRLDKADTPQTDWHYNEQDATWYPYKHEDEPQQKSCATCKHALGNWDGESNNCERCCGADRRFYEPIDDEPQTERSE